MRKYRPFLTYNPKRGWAFYPNRWANSFTPKTLGLPARYRKTMRERVGWFNDPATAIMFERGAR